MGAYNTRVPFFIILFSNIFSYFQIKDWTDGKQRNIRALLGSLSQILWDEAKIVWQQPSVAELFAPDKVTFLNCINF